MTFQRANRKEDTSRIKELALATGETGSDLVLSSFAGRVVVLLVFGMDCGTCKHMAGLLSELREEYAPELECIGVCMQTGCIERLDLFRRESGARLPLACCRSRELYSALGISPGTWLFYPTLIFIDQHQRMRGCFVGGDAFFEQAGDNIRAVLGQLLLDRPEYAAATEVAL